MAIKHSSTKRPAANHMSMQEFRQWLSRFDADQDGRISREELRRAIHSVRGRFSSWKSKKAIRIADADGNGYIDGDEIDSLVAFAQRSLGMKIACY